MSKTIAFAAAAAAAICASGETVELSMRRAAIEAAKTERAQNLLLKDPNYGRLDKLQVRSAPDYLRGAVMYQIFLRPFTSEGTLNAARAMLPHVKSLGTDIIYLCPIAESDRGTDRKYWSGRQKASKLENPCNPYRIMDYFKVDSEYGTEEDLKAFVAEAHKLGMKVYFDLVYYHCGPNAVFLKDKPEWVLREKDGSFTLGEWAFPRFDIKNPEVREYLFANMKWYLEEFKCDGFRCDVGDDLPLWYRVEAYKRCSEIKKDVVMLCEGGDPRDQQEAFDMNYGFHMQRAIAKIMETGNATNLQYGVETRTANFPRGFRWMRCFENHDLANCSPTQSRREKRWGRSMCDALLMTIFTLDGVPMIYNGQEVADEAKHNIWSNATHGRMRIDWSGLATESGAARLALVRKLTSLRHAERCLYDAPTEFIKTAHPESVYAYRRPLGAKTYVTAVNVSKNPVELSGFAGHEIFAGPAKISPDGTLLLPPRSGAILKIEK